ncbi:nitrite reductase (NAD(P)H), large subunit [Chthoniobacter flavus Ellin428]|uniref:Nitrite reductase (NAD(P)H), large subunit n=1 Tax=Chthoniobacter flavus Ellin428 TaxID=497964 RepID=B4DAB2_9BACT|nr:nitrite reductase large subunit NirB [Chthoniobacter flavus]EDY16573.1 nitrite reductase (NAD(P)H), large subunit [Chthoniobacter flavus Ellin428]TCO92004.1 nitrite reductase (NADH) large subunit [Chthoniobacter flavus]
MNQNKTKLVVVGNGMAGARVVEEILKRASDRFEIVMFGAEPYGNYNRILLSNVLNGSQAASEIFMNPLAWYRDNGIKLHAGVRATRIDRQRKVVIGAPLEKDALAYAADAAAVPDAALIEEPYDHVIIATGSRPFVPPMEGFGGPGTFLFRTLDDCDQIANYAKTCKEAAVIGGGLLGLEAARGLLTHGVEVTVLEAAPQLMIAQLDFESGKMLRDTMEGMGIQVMCEKITTKIVYDDGRIRRLDFKDGSTLETDMVVVSAGIRPITEIAAASGLTVNKGIVCDDQMRTSDRDIFAVGECVEHRHKLYGLVDPIWDQAKTLADVITGFNPKAEYLGSRLGTKLKVMGVELASMGDTKPSLPDDEVIVYSEPSRGVYKKMIVRENQIAGAILLGETDTAGVLMQMFMTGAAVPSRRADLLFGTSSGMPVLSVFDLPDHAQICNCNGISKGEIKEAIVIGKCHSVSKVGACTKAGLGCGSCKVLVAQLIEAYAGEVDDDPTEDYYVPGVPLEKAQLVAEIKRRGLKSVSAVFRELAGDKEDPGSKVGLASLLKTLWPGEYDDERDARFVNDRVHANIQKDGTFSVVPRIYGGVTSPAELRRIAEVAEKYNVPMVKFTGGQRLDLLGVKKDDLPKMWKDLGIPSGHAYTKAFRTCKSCVGTDFCRYGVGDSIKLAQEIEHRFQGIESPHKMKLATAGCPRNCSEAYVKDLGAVAIEGGKWEIYIGGAAGGSVRKGDLLCTVATHADVLKYMGRFMQYYREHGKYLERTYGFVERIGIEPLKMILVEDSEGICARLDAEIQKAVDAYKDPWKEAELPAYPGQFNGPELAHALELAENNG